MEKLTVVRFQLRPQSSHGEFWRGDDPSELSQIEARGQILYSFDMCFLLVGGITLGEADPCSQEVFPSREVAVS